MHNRSSFGIHESRFFLKRGGFTLLEILTVVAIIGTLTSIGTVSYQSARATSRDTKRGVDMKNLQLALEIFHNANGYYPGDGQGGEAGLILGVEGASSLSDGGFSDGFRGNVYMSRVPPNAEPGGLPYTYRSLDLEGNDCNDRQCANFAVIFGLEKGYGTLGPGPNAVTRDGYMDPRSRTLKGVTMAGRVVGIDSLRGTMAVYADDATEAFGAMVESKTVRQVAEAGVAPAATAAALANAAVAVNATAGTATAGQYLLFFLTQPVLLWRRRHRKFWGTVYNSLTRLPEDLAIVRLRDFDSGRVIRSEVTDRDGRYSFLAPHGRYRIEVTKANVVFPSRLTEGKKSDGPYLDVYHGEEISVGMDGGSVIPNIPVDPIGVEMPDSVAVRQDRIRRLQSNVALVSPVLGLISFAIKPSVLTGVLFVVQLLVYLLFRRIANPTALKNWGLVYEDGSGKPIYQAIVRIFALPYHKLTETKVTDRGGRYNFRVGSAKYYVTVTKNGFLKTETEEIDFSEAKTPMFVAADLPLRRKAETADGGVKNT